MKTVLVNKFQLKTFLIFILMFFFLPLGGLDGEYTSGHEYFSFYELGFPIVVFNVGKPTDWSVLGLLGPFLLLFAYIFSHMATFAIKTFRSRRTSGVVRKIISTALALIFVVLFALIVLNIYARFFILPYAPDTLVPPRI